MKWLVVGARTLVGLMFVVFGLNGLTPKPFIELPMDQLPEQAKSFLFVLAGSGYLTVVKVLEVLGGVLLLSGRAAPLGITLLTPIAVNILLYEVFVLQAPGPGYLLVPLLAFLVWGYRAYFAPVFTLNARTTPCCVRTRDEGWDVQAGTTAAKA